MTDGVWGGIWTRPGLDRRSRSQLDLGILTALRAHEGLEGHVRGALGNRLTHTEFTETIGLRLVWRLSALTGANSRLDPSIAVTLTWHHPAEPELFAGSMAPNK